MKSAINRLFLLVFWFVIAWILGYLTGKYNGYQEGRFDMISHRIEPLTPGK